MEITEVRVKLVSGKNDKLRAFCSITIDDDFVIRDLKVIDGVKGPFVAMPSRKLMERCEKCSSKNHYRAKHCHECGTRLTRQGVRRSESGRSEADGADDDVRSKLHTEIAHPINSGCREMIQRRVLMEYRSELEDRGDTGTTPSRGGEAGATPSRAGEGEGFEDYFQQEERAVHTSTGTNAGGGKPATNAGGGKPAFDDPSVNRWHAKDSQAANDSTPADPSQDRFKKGGPEKPEEKKIPRLHDFEDAASSLDEEPEDNFGAGSLP